MAKTIVARNTYNVKFPNQKGKLIKIIEDDVAPRPEYLWKKDGYLYVYYEDEWVYINDYIAIINSETEEESPCIKMSKEDVAKLENDLRTAVNGVQESLNVVLEKLNTIHELDEQLIQAARENLLHVVGDTYAVRFSSATSEFNTSMNNLYIFITYIEHLKDEIDNK